MRPRTIRRLPRRQTPQEPVRTFTYNSAIHGSRPQLPFLATPSSRPDLLSRQQWRRYLSTEKQDRMIKVRHYGRIFAYSTGVAVCLFLFKLIIESELKEKNHPTPREWSYITRVKKRSAEAEKIATDVVMPSWVRIAEYLKEAIARLEDETIDGKGVRELGPSCPPGAKDISAKPESWRRGYFETLLLYCEACEQLDGWVMDTKSGILFPGDVVVGPSNPNPMPMPPSKFVQSLPPREEDCKPAAYPRADDCYLKLMGTEGLTAKQRMDATIAYANWLEFKGHLGPAAAMLEDALVLAVGEMSPAPDSPPLLDPKTMAFNDAAGRLPSANLLASLTEVATFKARHEDIAGALPILISILNARKSLPNPPFTNPSRWRRSRPQKGILDYLIEPSYPPPPPDGSAPPLRDSEELCREAALDLHIGEIMFTLQPSMREQGWAWTREGVDLAEEELHKLVEARLNKDDDARRVCRECLSVGLGNWATMVKRLAKEEKEAAEKAKAGGKSTAGWFGLWSNSGVAEENPGRWATEQKLCEERTERAQRLLDDTDDKLYKTLTGWSMI